MCSLKLDSATVPASVWRWYGLRWAPGYFRLFSCPVVNFRHCTKLSFLVTKLAAVLLSF